MKTICTSLILVLTLVGIIAIGQPIEQGDGKTIIIIMHGQRIEEPKLETSSFKQKDQKPKDKWLQHWVKRMMLSKKVFKIVELVRLMLSDYVIFLLC